MNKFALAPYSKTELFLNMIKCIRYRADKLIMLLNYLQ